MKTKFKHLSKRCLPADRELRTGIGANLRVDDVLVIEVTLKILGNQQRVEQEVHCIVD